MGPADLSAGFSWPGTRRMSDWDWNIIPESKEELLGFFVSLLIILATA